MVPAARGGLVDGHPLAVIEVQDLAAAALLAVTLADRSLARTAR